MGVFDFLEELTDEVVTAAKRNAEHKVTVEWNSPENKAIENYIAEDNREQQKDAVAYAKATVMMEQETDPIKKREMECLIEKGVYDFSLLDD